MATTGYVLFEHATGYSLFQVSEFEEIGENLSQVEQSVSNLNKFDGMVKLLAFMSFTDNLRALENANAISEGILHEDLQKFLEDNLPKSTKKSKIILGVGEAKIAAAIAESRGISCQTTGIVPEVIRGIRLHFAKLAKLDGLTPETANKAQLGLGHSYSRSKVKFNVNRVDNMIIQSIAILDQLDKDVNTFTMRIREWYGYHFPELIRIVPDNYLYTQLVSIIGERQTLEKDGETKIQVMRDLLEDEDKLQHVLEAARTSIGAEIPEVDLQNVQTFCSKVNKLAAFRLKLHGYLRDKMAQCSPSLAALIGEQVGARLISHAGSLTNLAKFPASTVQILGAEKALFRALKTRGNTPKYGLIYHSSFIGKAKAKDKGRISRYLANKCSIAARLDCFSEMPSAVVGEHLRKQVEDRLKYIEGGENPPKNVDVMKEAVKEAEAAKQAYLKSTEKKKKKKRVKTEEAEETAEEAVEALEGKKKKKKRPTEDVEMEHEVEQQVPAEEEQETEEQPAKKKKKKKSKQVAEE
ncbi:nucleolar protein 56-like [Paramacrobiotus metropolitanus]|uniref:nucleolar protein 56-like n=1 Tax=Paramacrobiotus metropolitanus TaxID=2943436 RepID=UPI0024465841|nr:nucleolar protein 56-like [Paramacrobiotus metropolitanus]